MSDSSRNPNSSVSGPASNSSSGDSILQVFTFYDAYLAEFYARRPGLSSAPFAVQMRELYHDGFGVLHVYAPALNELGVRADWVIANCEPAQRRWAVENGVTLSSANWRDEILTAQITAFAPSALYFLNSIDFDSRFIRSLPKRPAAVIGWRAADIPKHIDWSAFDLILSHLSVCREQAIEHGARRAEYFHPSVPTFLADQTRDIPRTFDVVFSGQWTPEHHVRNTIINAVAEASIREGFSFGLFLSSHNFQLPPAVAHCNKGARWGAGMYQALRGGKIVLNAEIDLARGEAGNMRLFETTAVGSFLLTEHQRNIERYLVPGQHIDTYQSIDELLNKIRYYIQVDAKREGMALAAQAHIQTSFSPIAGARKLLQFCSEIRAGKQFPNESDARGYKGRPAAQLRVDSAIAQLRNGDVNGALLTVEQIKVIDQPVRDLELVRGICFGKLARFEDASRALERELQAFPDNGEARQLLQDISAQIR